jgi:uncharacterized membrane protein YccF (DUF307 family)
MNWLWFLAVGWWAGIAWFTLGLVLCMTIILWPAGVAMIWKTPDIMFGET